MEPNQKPDKFSSSIRTMENDLEAVSKGAEPSGALIEKTIEKPLSPSSQKESAPQDLPVPRPEQNISDVKLGEFRKAKSLAPPSPPPFIQKSYPSLPPPPPKNSVPAPVSGGISVPTGKNPIFSGRNLLILAIVLVVSGLAAWLLINRNRTSVIVESPTPVVSATPIGSDFILSASLDPFSSLFLFLNGLKVNPQEFKIFKVLDENKRELALTGFSDKFSLNFPSSVVQSLGDLGRIRLLTYGQTEKISQFPPSLSYGILIKADSSFENQDSVAALVNNLKNYESAISPNIVKMFDLNANDASSESFSDNNYNGQAIRYKNFSLPDRTIDYAVISDDNSMYLAIVNSRELMFSVIDNFANIVTDSDF